MIKLIAINSVDGKAEPIPKGEMAIKKMIPPNIPHKKSFILERRNTPIRICPKAIRDTNNDVFELNVPVMNF
jgi:hypothetical protein